MEKESIAIDTCIFLNLLDFEESYDEISRSVNSKNKEEIVRKYIENDFLKKKDELSDLKQKILNDIKKNIEVSSTSISTKDKIAEYLEVLNNNNSRLSNKIRDYNKKLSSNIPDTLKEGYRKSLVGINEKYQKYYKQLKLFKEDVNKYNVLKTELISYNLYKDILDEKVDVYITGTCKDEIDNHNRANKNHIKDESRLYEDKYIKALYKRCSVIYYKSKLAKEKSKEIANLFRTTQDYDDENSLPMKGDTNSLGEYGDSFIAAETNLAGLTLVTANKKDFITQTSKGTIPVRRNHILKVAEHNKPYTTDAKPIDTEEYYIHEQKLIKQQIKQEESELQKTEKINKHSKLFKQEIIY